jgi:GTP-binding protein
LSKPVVAIIGRQNVGKSTLLNRVAGKQLAIVEDFPGTTRDRIFADATWNGIDFTVVDTGGLEFREESSLAKGVRAQAEAAINEADILIFLTDAKEGIMADDREIANILRRTQKPVILVVNKVDNEKQEADAAEFYQLGFDEVFFVSSYHSRGVADFLDRLIELLPPQPPEDQTLPPGIRVAIVGRPHVGKSLLLNKLLGQERTIVGETPGTTRDAIDTVLDFKGQNVILIDTAGIRRRGSIDQGIESYSVLRALRAIDRADIALLVVDALETMAAQDTHIAGYIEKAGKGIITLVNKWDLATEKNKTVYNEYIYSRLKFTPYAPILYISAKTGQGVDKIMPLALQIEQERSMLLPEQEVNDLIKKASASHNLPHKGKLVLAVHSARQTGTRPPSFQILVNDTKLVHFSYERFLENQIRGIYSFKGTPIRLVFKARG